MKNLDNESKKSLRSTSQYFLDMSRRLEKAFLKFLMFSGISAERLILMSDQVQTVKGLETGRLSGDSSSVDESIQYLIQQHPELESCKIASSYCSDASVQALFLIPNMSIIKLTHCELITGEILVHDLDSEVKPKLKVLILVSCCKLTDIGLVSLLNLTDGESLIELNLALTKITLSNIGDLTNRFPNLKKLSLRRCDNITDAGIILLLTRVGGDLEDLDLSETNVTLDNIGDLTNRFPNLKKLNLLGCRNITDAGTVLLLNRVGGDLEDLDLSDTNITLNSMGDLNSRFLKLEVLSFYFCRNITDAGTILLLNRVGGELKHLNLSDTNIALNRMGDLTSSFPKLEYVDLKGCPNITEANVISLLSKVEHIVQVDIRYTPVAAASIRDQFHSLIVYDETVD